MTNYALTNQKALIRLTYSTVQNKQFGRENNVMQTTSSKCSIMLSYSDQISVKKSREDHFSKKLMKVQKDTDKTLTQLLTYMNHFIQPVKKLPRKGM